MPRSSPDSEEDARPRRGSTRVQFSACGACRLRRVKCDLKELEVDKSNEKMSCTNCLERGLKCVDVFGHHQAKSIKVRQGRRLQQVRAIYGNLQDDPSSKRPATIPALQPEFFSSLFWRSFSLQHPILDAIELPARFTSHIKGQNSLTKEGSLLFSTLVVWAATFGVNECGHSIASPTADTESTTQTTKLAESDSPTNRARLDRKKRCETMVNEIMECVDAYGIMRLPSWDGVRILLLLWPLLAETSFLQSQTVYHMALSQARVLCTNTVPSQHDRIVRSRVFWYAHQQDGIVGGIRGGKLVFDDDDIFAFHNPQAISPPDPSAFANALAFSPTLKCRDSVEAAEHLRQNVHHPAVISPEPMNFYMAIPLQISSVCRRIHATLSGLRAKQCPDVDTHAIRRIWEELDTCWSKLESFGASCVRSGDDGANLERFIASWQLFVFQCHNTIRDLLKRRIVTHSPDTPTVLQAMHSTSTTRCLQFLPKVLEIMSCHLKMDEGALFKFDSGLVRDGCFFAGALISSGGLDLLGSSMIDYETSLTTCLRALEEMRWVFCRGEERIATLQTMRRERENARAWMQGNPSVNRNPPPPPPPPASFSPIYPTSSSHFQRPILAPISVPSGIAPTGSPSPATASSGGSFWASYTPPTSSGTSGTSHLQGSVEVPVNCPTMDQQFGGLEGNLDYSNTPDNWGEQPLYPTTVHSSTTYSAGSEENPTPIFSHYPQFSGPLLS